MEIQKYNRGKEIQKELKNLIETRERYDKANVSINADQHLPDGWLGDTLTPESLMRINKAKRAVIDSYIDAIDKAIISLQKEFEQL